MTESVSLIMVYGLPRYARHQDVQHIALARIACAVAL